MEIIALLFCALAVALLCAPFFSGIRCPHGVMYSSQKVCRECLVEARDL